jgi:RNA polymerase sigma-70 factor (ECF subfamily)
MNPLFHFCKDRELKSSIAEQRNSIYRIAYSWCHDEALSDDLTQETMSKALNKYKTLKNPASLRSWLYGILANCWRDHYRRQREFIDIEDCILSNEQTPESEYQRQFITDSILTAVADLPINQRQTLTLVDLEGFSYAEVADILQTPIGTVMSRLCRARKSLTQELLNLKTQMSDTRQPSLRIVK